MSSFMYKLGLELLKSSYCWDCYCLYF